MVSAHVYIGISLDGFIARPDDAIDFLDTIPIGDEDHGYFDFIADKDGLIMGRGTFEKVLTFGDWPFEKPVIVMSRTLAESDLDAALQGRVFLCSRTPQEALTMAAEMGWQKAYLDGGQLIQSFLREGLVEDMVLTRLPILIGQGKPLFGELTEDIMLEHVSTRSFPTSGFVQSHYRVKR